MKFIQILLFIILLVNFTTAEYIIESSEETILDSIFSWFSNLGNLITGFATQDDKSEEYLVEVGDVVILKKEEVVTYTSGLKFQFLSIFDKNNVLLLNLATGKELLLEKGKPNEESSIDLLFIETVGDSLVFTSGIADYPLSGAKSPVVYTNSGNSFLMNIDWLFKISDKASFILKTVEENKVGLLDQEGIELVLVVNQPQEFQSLNYKLISIDPVIINVKEVSGCKQGEVLIARGEIDGSIVYQCVEVLINIDISKIPNDCSIPICNSNLKVIGQESDGCLTFDCENNPDCEILPSCTGGVYELTKVNGDCLSYECIGGCQEPPVCSENLVIKSWQDACPVYDCEIQEVDCIVPYCEGTLNIVGTDVDGCSIYECQDMAAEFSLECSYLECSGNLVDTGAVDAIGCIVYACQELVVESGEFTLEISLKTGELSGENVQVYVLNEQWAVLDKSITDSSGKTTFALLPENYIIMIDNEQFLLAQEKIILEKNTILEIVLEPSASAPCPTVQQPLLQAGCVAIPIKDGACITSFDVSCSGDNEEVVVPEDLEEVEQTSVNSIKPKITEQRSVQVIELVETVKEVLVKPACKPVCTVLCGGFDGCGGQCPDDDIKTPGECGNPSIEEVEAEPNLVTGTSNVITTFFNFLFN